MWKIHLLFVCVLFFGCTEKKPHIDDQVSDKLNQVDTKNDESTIPIYEVVFDSSKEISGHILKDVLPTISKSFDAYPYTSSSNELKEKIENLEAKRFLISLAKDFDNKTFESVKAIDFVNVSPNDSKNESIQIEQWSFENKGIATSCFESLTSFKEREIHFMTVNWIWLQQEDKILLISSANYGVNSKEMQIIKKAIAEEIKKSGTFKSIAFYE